MDLSFRGHETHLVNCVFGFSFCVHTKRRFFVCFSQSPCFKSLSLFPQLSYHVTDANPALTPPSCLPRTTSLTTQNSYYFLSPLPSHSKKVSHKISLSHSPCYMGTSVNSLSSPPQTPLMPPTCLE